MATCKIVVKDECNIKLEGLDLADRKALMKRFEHDAPGARFLPSVRLGRWNGKVSNFSLGGSAYVNLLPDIIPYLERAGYDLVLEDLRDYLQSFSLKEVSENTFAEKNWPKGHPLAGEPIILRDYQITIINLFLNNLQCVQEVATGAGKCLAGNTVLTIGIDENTPFGKFLINKLLREQENDVTTNNKHL